MIEKSPGKIDDIERSIGISHGFARRKGSTRGKCLKEGIGSAS